MMNIEERLRAERCPWVCPTQYQEMVLALGKDGTLAFAKELELSL